MHAWQGPDGFSDEFSGHGLARSDVIRIQKPGEPDYLQVKDVNTGRDHFFKITRKS
jgi:hypothetical protein